MSKLFVLIGLAVPNHLDPIAGALVSDLLQEAIATRGLSIAMGGVLVQSPEDVERLAYYAGRGVDRDNEDWQQIWTKMGKLSQAVDRVVAEQKKAKP